MRTTFLVGRLSPKGAEMVLAESVQAPPPIPGPWRLRALVRPAYNLPDPSALTLEDCTVH